jgi:hypothetical protein
MKALGRLDAGEGERPAPYRSAWRQAGVAESVVRLTEPTNYARSPRRTLGATRA